MIGRHEQKYIDKKKGNAYVKQKILLENRAIYYKQKIKNLGTEVNVIKVKYQKVIHVVDKDVKVPGSQVYNMYFSNVSGESAKLLLLQAEPAAVNIETFPLYLRTEFSVR